MNEFVFFPVRSVPFRWASLIHLVAVEMSFFLSLSFTFTSSLADSRGGRVFFHSEYVDSHIIPPIFNEHM